MRMLFLFLSIGCLLALAGGVGMWITFFDLPAPLADASRFDVALFHVIRITLAVVALFFIVLGLWLARLAGRHLLGTSPRQKRDSWASACRRTKTSPML